jgi:hypothetical protein
MKTETSISDRAVAGLNSKAFSSRIPSIVFALTVMAGAVYAAAIGPVVYSTGQRLRTEQLQQEDKLFCQKFNMPFGSESFPTCVGYLSQIRRLHAERVGAEAAGMP